MYHLRLQQADPVGSADARCCLLALAFHHCMPARSPLPPQPRRVLTVQNDASRCRSDAAPGHAQGAPVVWRGVSGRAPGRWLPVSKRAGQASPSSRPQPPNPNTPPPPFLNRTCASSVARAACPQPAARSSCPTASRSACSPPTTCACAQGLGGPLRWHCAVSALGSACKLQIRASRACGDRQAAQRAPCKRQPPTLARSPMVFKPSMLTPPTTPTHALATHPPPTAAP